MSEESKSSDLNRNENHPATDGELSEEELSSITGGVSGLANPFSYGTKPGDSTENDSTLGLHDMMRVKRDVNNEVFKGFKD